MEEFWEKHFQQKKQMWGMEPANAALVAAELFAGKGFKDILIPGIGYGRNAYPFLDKGMNVTGIEISKTAIALADQQFADELKIFEGSVTQMPFDDHLYDGIFCHGLIHLLDKAERLKLIGDCYHQLADQGYMVFTTITKEAKTYGQGTEISKDRFEMFGGVQLFFYDKQTIEEDFGASGLFEVSDITENFPFYLIKCRKA